MLFGGEGGVGCFSVGGGDDWERLQRMVEEVDDDAKEERWWCSGGLHG